MSGLLQLTADEMYAAWQWARKTYPQEFRVTPEQVWAWHRRESEACVKEKNASPAIFHALHASPEWLILSGWPVR